MTKFFRFFIMYLWFTYRLIYVICLVKKKVGLNVFVSLKTLAETFLGDRKSIRENSYKVLILHDDLFYFNNGILQKHIDIDCQFQKLLFCVLFLVMHQSPTPTIAATVGAASACAGWWFCWEVNCDQLLEEEIVGRALKLSSWFTNL